MHFEKEIQNRFDQVQDLTQFEKKNFKVCCGCSKFNVL
jgi:hypothetical protein